MGIIIGFSGLEATLGPGKSIHLRKIDSQREVFISLSQKMMTGEEDEQEAKGEEE